MKSCRMYCNTINCIFLFGLVAEWGAALVTHWFLGAEQLHQKSGSGSIAFCSDLSAMFINSHSQALDQAELQKPICCTKIRVQKV